MTRRFTEEYSAAGRPTHKPSHCYCRKLAVKNCIKLLAAIPICLKWCNRLPAVPTYTDDNDCTDVNFRATSARRYRARVRTSLAIRSPPWRRIALVCNDISYQTPALQGRSRVAPQVVHRSVASPPIPSGGRKPATIMMMGDWREPNQLAGLPSRHQTPAMGHQSPMATIGFQNIGFVICNQPANEFCA